MKKDLNFSIRREKVTLRFSGEIVKSGNSLSVNIPARLVKKYKIEPNIEVDVILKAECFLINDKLNILEQIKEARPELKRFKDADIMRYAMLKGISDKMENMNIFTKYISESVDKEALMEIHKVWEKNNIKIKFMGK